jgi:hypothetical protein
MSRHAVRTVAAACLMALALVACGEDRKGEIRTNQLSGSEAATYEYVVPFGTGNRLDGGEVIELMPAELNVKVGESIRIRNQDTRDYMIGPFFVTAGQTLAMEFTHPGELSGVCVVGAGGSFVINVTE